MRRLLAFAMCVSGFTLAISWSRADEPTATEDAQPGTLAGEPSARPVVVRTEPGEQHAAEKSVDRDVAAASELIAPEKGRAERRRRLDDARLRNWLRIYDHSSRHGSTIPVVEQQLERLGHLEQAVEQLPGKYVGRELELARARFEQEIALIERFLDEVQERQAADAAAKQEAQAAKKKPADDPRTKLAEQSAAEQIRELQNRMAELQAGEGPVAQRLQKELERLRQLAGEVEQSAGKEAEAVREEIERQIDNVERYLRERRERRDAAEKSKVPFGEGEAHADAEMRALRERLRHLQAAIEHLNAAGMPEVARDLQRHAENLRREAELHRTANAQREAALRAVEEAEREAAELRERVSRDRELLRQRERKEAAAREADKTAERETDVDGVREIAEQVRELRQELRRMRAEIDELRNAHAPPEKE